METFSSPPVSTRIVFDTNVLLSAIVFKKFAGDVYDYCVDKFDLYTLAWIVAEVEEKVRYKFKLPSPIQETIMEEVR